MADILELYSDYQRKKWFPQKYSDPYGEFIDFINEDAIRNLQLKSRTTKNRGILQIAFELTKLLPQVHLQDLYKDYTQVYQQILAPAGCRPEFCYFHLRKLPSNERNDLWVDFIDWNNRSHSKMLQWHKERTRLENSFSGLQNESETSYGINKNSRVQQIDSWLISSRDSFELDFKKYSDAASLPDAISSFRLDQWDEVYDWNDFHSLARSFFDQCLIEKRPTLRKAEIDDGIQFCFPIFPPERVVIEHRTTAGPSDAVRFIAELAKGAFYAHMNPQISSEFRFSGDPRLVHFWSALYVLAFIRGTGLRLIVGPLAQDLSSYLERFVQFWYRYDAFLACYRDAAEKDLNSAEDFFAANWRKAFHLNIPAALNLYDFDRAAGALSRVEAMDAALLVEERLRTLYGNAWFASSQCATRIRDYWWEGFFPSLADTLQDLDIRL